jgi:hypothetical protein
LVPKSVDARAVASASVRTRAAVVSARPRMMSWMMAEDDDVEDAASVEGVAETQLRRKQSAATVEVVALAIVVMISCLMEVLTMYARSSGEPWWPIY